MVQDDCSSSHHYICIPESRMEEETNQVMPPSLKDNSLNCTFHFCLYCTNQKLVTWPYIFIPIDNVPRKGWVGDEALSLYGATRTLILSFISWISYPSPRPFPNSLTVSLQSLLSPPEGARVPFLAFVISDPIQAPELSP